eukprot:g14139.t1
MESNMLRNDRHRTAPPESGVKTSPTSRWLRGLKLACGSVHPLTVLVTLKWTLWCLVAVADGAVTDVTAVFSDAGLTDTRRLAVVVPTHATDLEEAVAALSSWRNICSAITLHRMQLVLYYSGSMEDGLWSEGIVRDLEQTGGRCCFEQTKVVFADLDEKDNVYSKARTVMFYKLFLDDDVARSFQDYAALAILDWHVVVAHPTSFESLYKATFVDSEEFWMKGSTTVGTECHENAGVSATCHVPGHLNGNAIYNNTDPGFNEFVNFTLNRWHYTYPYAVALWATIADFPYSQPLWQRYSSKFVSSQLIATEGFHEVTRAAVGMAVSGDTLFIDGISCVGRDTANNAGTLAEDSGAVAVRSCTSACGLADEHMISDTSTLCDSSCLPDWSSTGPRFNGYGCGASDPARFGESCRQCYTSQEAALVEERRLSSAEVMGPTSGVHVVMCSTGNPPPASECSEECMNADDTVCDYRGDTTRGEMCAFLVGYFEFLPEARVAVSSVSHFMPGMKVGIATHPWDFHVFNRTLGKYSMVNVVNSSHVEHAALNADKACGPGTRLIFYMGIGEVLSRPFTEKDTHTPRAQGNLTR